MPLDTRSIRQIAPRRQRANVRGFTLVELVITLAVLAIVMAIAVPAFQTMVLNSRMTSATNELVAVFQEARMEAVRRRARVVICPSTTGAACGGTDWRKTITFIENGNDNAVGAGDAVLRVSELKSDGLTVTASPSLSTASVWFGPDGLVSVGAVATATRNAAIRLCSTKLTSVNARDISIAMSRVAVQPADSRTCSAPPNPTN